MRYLISIIIIVGLIFLAGCTEEQEDYYRDKYEPEVRSEISKIVEDKVNSQIDDKKNCRELNGYLCNQNQKCALDWLDSTDSYCCPIECNKCTEEELSKCKTEEQCVEAVCDPETNFECEYRNIVPCANNGICEQGEYEGSVNYCDGSGAETATTGDFKSSDCPKTCDDNDKNTADYYNFTTQRCEHIECKPNNIDTYIKVDEDTYNVNDVLVTIKLYNIKDKGIGEYIVIKNNRDDIVKIGVGCNWPVSPYANGCRGWSLRPYVDYPTFNHKYIEPKSEVEGWVWGITEDFLEPFNTTQIKLTIQVDGQEIAFEKYLEDIEDSENVNYIFSDYNDYQDFVKDKVEDLIGMEDIGNYGGQEARYGGSVYFLYYKKGEWDFYHYWAVEVDAESGELIKYKDITASDGSRDRFDEVWWTPER